MLLHTECFNPYHTNCYFLTDEESGSTVIIDPGCYFRRERTRVQHLIRLNDWHIVQILATHLHIDHIFGVHLTESIRHQLLRFPDDTAVYPGHYEPTTVGAEKAMLL
ncbi:MBL fold metallo-hydrolase [Phocaeicola barnesiae]|uniref:MBL fold metallo-hydrolase n=1 Tax=Phocaeicola barnesiae TaxID=376804 RepID=UPI0025A3DD5A|nr:MBL fold metallo-hydrolase [Phocaeicola barnesiae]MDM8309396.1 MBL fold metallo-hydrolase [Phocaeicola barnesiae]